MPLISSSNMRMKRKRQGDYEWRCNMFARDSLLVLSNKPWVFETVKRYGADCTLGITFWFAGKFIFGAASAHI